MAGKITLYEDKSDPSLTRWRREEGGNITGDSGQGYEDARHAAEQAEAALQPGDELIADGEVIARRMLDGTISRGSTTSEAEADLAADHPEASEGEPADEEPA